MPQSSLVERTHPAWQRVKFDELLAQQLSLARARAARRAKTAPILRGGARVERFLAQLPFALTDAQRRVVAEIDADLARPHPMQRLLQGDVGSGKTVVAAIAALRAIDSGHQAVLMAPTEILAEQHFAKLADWIEALGVPVAWLTGSLTKKRKASARDAIESGVARLAIGTHALIQEDVRFANLGLAIVDEQHRFGVGQRLALRFKARAGHDAVRARAASADDERDADPADARDDVLRRPRRVDDRRVAAGPQADRRRSSSTRHDATRSSRASAARSPTAGRRTGSAR